jgi:hypothetical protein
MSLVTGFESQTPEADGAKALNESFGFENLYDVLSNDPIRGEDIFAAWAKRLMRHLIPNPVVMDINLERYPRWTAQTTCSLHVGDLRNAVLLRAGLEGLVKGLASAIEAACGKESTVTLGALMAKVSMTGPQEITFRLAQKWCGA